MTSKITDTPKPGRGRETVGHCHYRRRALLNGTYSTYVDFWFTSTFQDIEHCEVLATFPMSGWTMGHCLVNTCGQLTSRLINDAHKYVPTLRDPTSGHHTLQCFTQPIYVGESVDNRKFSLV